MQYPPGYDEFETKVRQFVVLDVLEKVIHYDYKQLQQAPLKSGSVVAKLLNFTHDKVISALSQTRGEISRSDGKILQIEQERDSRVVTFVFRGYSYSNSFFNAHLRAMCEDVFWRFVTDK
ncbi:hypothetical protein GCM10011571_33060 [Marinithermofilum abyssi]|uniref:Uncharacterized protein n=1 Tax=Marinithermofilum abyssi TaxID=1571185 RepID=A0A8J2VK41_9BACL|nr:hypothetical protein [Marinithermofilum abyssi]GGE28349.1 hypothetical protein GCM10011571_33060 [Marinithermofilum abyssi]